ncbi:MAG: hypothetical protein KIC37_03410 [Coriobacteriaceae bacterium]|nr:hypothetical protein [Coriobacteriaceae bacterium]
MLKKLKDAVLGLFAWAMLVSIIPGCTYFNLKSNSVYYAQHTPHKEDCEPVLMMLIDNLEDIYTPDDPKTIGYDFDGEPAILTYDKNGKQLGFLTPDGEGGYMVDNENLIFHFSNDFQLENICDVNKGYEQIDMKGFSERDIKKDIYKSVQPLIDAQSKPWINLQWLFDIVYHDRFN